VPDEVTRLALTFDRQLSDEEVESLKQTADALLVFRLPSLQASHHHDHETVVGVGGPFRPSEDVTLAVLD
jgi:hypothetical protein